MVVGEQSFGCQMWDAAFAAQAISSSGLIHEYATTLKNAHDFIKASQVIIQRYSLTFKLNSYKKLDQVNKQLSNRLWRIQLGILRRCIDIHQKVHGPSQCKIMVGKSLTALLKALRYVVRTYELYCVVFRTVYRIFKGSE